MAADGLGGNDILIGAVTYHDRLLGFEAKGLYSQAENLRIGFAHTDYGRFYDISEEAFQPEFLPVYQLLDQHADPEFILNERETAYKYLVDQPYNQECNFEGSRVKSLSEAVDLICR